MNAPAVITIGLDPFIHVGPLTIAWHGLTIALGILLGTVLAARWLRERTLATEPLYALAGLLALGGIVGGRLFYLMEHGGPLFGTNGFTFDGGVIVAALLLFGYVRRRQLSLRYLDAIAAGLPLGVAVGRIGDVINGEHYGPRSDFLVRSSRSDTRACPAPAGALAVDRAAGLDRRLRRYPPRRRAAGRRALLRQQGRAWRPGPGPHLHPAAARPRASSPSRLTASVAIRVGVGRKPGTARRGLVGPACSGAGAGRQRVVRAVGRASSRPD